MRKFVILLLAALMLCFSASAETQIDAVGDRGIILDQPQENTVPEGISPTTGRVLKDLEIPEGAAGLAADGRYMPMLVQISNPISDKTRAAGTSNRAPWGVQYADIFYETPLTGHYETRISVIFSDILPTFAGPIRSARIGHVWIREEWDSGFIYYGQSTYGEGNVPLALAQFDVEEKGLLFSGVVSASRPWKKYFSRGFMNRATPNDVSADVAAMSKLIPENHVPLNHTFRFADAPYEGGDEATTIWIDWGRPDYNSRFTYDAATGLYSRSVSTDTKKRDYVDYTELTTGDVLTFSNVIVQWTPTEFPNSEVPITRNVASGNFPGHANADIFQNGRHISGYWRRYGTQSRTIFYDDQGHELELQPGKTFIIQLPPVKACIYE